MIKLKDLLLEKIGTQVSVPRPNTGGLDPSKLPKGKLKITGDWLNKPKPAFWTSSWHGKGTEWLDWVNTEMPMWNAGDGIVFEVKGGKIYTIKNKKDYEKLYKEFPNEHVTTYLDWPKLSKKYDAVHVKSPHAHEALSAWDVESIAWLNMKPLNFVGTVKV